MKTLGFIGMGNMAGAIAAGILQKGLRSICLRTAL